MRDREKRLRDPEILLCSKGFAFISQGETGEQKQIMKKCLPEASLWEELPVSISVTTFSSFHRNTFGRRK